MIYTSLIKLSCLVLIILLDLSAKELQKMMLYTAYILPILPRAFVPPSRKATESNLQQS